MQLNPPKTVQICRLLFSKARYLIYNKIYSFYIYFLSCIAETNVNKWSVCSSWIRTGYLQIMSKRTRKIFSTRKNWPQPIKMTPQYIENEYLSLLRLKLLHLLIICLQIPHRDHFKDIRSVLTIFSRYITKSGTRYTIAPKNIVSFIIRKYNIITNV